MNVSPSWKSGMAILGAAACLARVPDEAAAQERLIDDRDYRYIGEWRCKMDDPRIHGLVIHYPGQATYHTAHGTRHRSHIPARFGRADLLRALRQARSEFHRSRARSMEGQP